MRLFWGFADSRQTEPLGRPRPPAPLGDRRRYTKLIDGGLFCWSVMPGLDPGVQCGFLDHRIKPEGAGKIDQPLRPNTRLAPFHAQVAAAHRQSLTHIAGRFSD